MKLNKTFGSVIVLIAMLVLGQTSAQQVLPAEQINNQPVDVDVLQKLPFDAVDTEAGVITLDGVDYELNLIDDGYFSRQQQWKSLKQLRSGKKYIVHIYFDDEAAMKQKKGGSVVYIGELPPPY